MPGRPRLALAVAAVLASCGGSANPAADASIVDAVAGDAAVDGSPASRFAAKVDLTSAPNPTSVALGDLDGDGRPDLVAANTNGTTISVFINQTPASASTPSFGTKLDLTTGLAPASVVIGDLDGDGKPDLATANVGASTVSVLLNTTAPGAATLSFAAAVDFPCGANPEVVAIGDLDGDGKPDLATANVGATTASVLVNTMAMGATTPSFADHLDVEAGMTPVAVVAGDLNGDGRLDLAIANLTANTASILLNTTPASSTPPSFAAAVDFPTGQRANALAAGDLDGDGLLDLVVPDGDADTVSILVNTTAIDATTPSLAAKVDVATGAGPGSVAIVDLDGDGRRDLAVSLGSSAVEIFLNTTPSAAATPSFAVAGDFAVGPGPRFVASGDLNGDRKPDLAVANGLSNTISILLAR